MKQKFIALLLVLLFVPTLLISAQANEVGKYVFDNANLLSESEIWDLEEKIQDISNAYGMDVVILTLDSLNGVSAQDAADDFYDYNGYSKNGVLFLLAMKEREWYISTSGQAIYALTDYGIQQVGNAMLPDLANGAYCDAFDVYLNELPVYFEALENGKPIDGYADYSGDYYHGDRDEVLYYEDGEGFTPSLFVSLLVGLAVGGISILIMRAGMNTKNPQRSANEYMRSGSYKLRIQQDLFLYSQVTKTRKQESSNGGGSSVHSSSSGRSHGGGGGRF